MAKRMTFEEILTTEFRWPRSGDTPFTKSDNWQKNACLASDINTRLVLMTDGYKKAGDLMVSHAVAERGDRDFLVFPIIFNYRQFLELSLKSLLSNYGRHVDVNENWKSHDLALLWSEFEKMLEIFGTPDPDDADPIVKEIVAEFSKIDPGSYSYRYPVDKNGNAIPLNHELLDLENLADVINATAGYFSGCDGYLSHLVDC